MYQLNHDTRSCKAVISDDPDHTLDRTWPTGNREWVNKSTIGRDEMKLSELFEYVIKRGVKRDPRGKEGIDRYLSGMKKDFEKLPESEKWEFDQERLWNPYDDSRILNNPDDPEIRRVLMGINIDSAEIVLADRLREKGEHIDAVIGHHPRGIGMPGLHKVMDVQVDLYARWGVPVNVGEQLMEPRISEVMRAFMPMNHQQSVDSARLLGIPFMCTHSPSDIMVQEFVQDRMNEKEPYSVNDVIGVLKEIPEYRNGIRFKNGPKIIVGKGSNRAGKVVVKMAGGTGGAKTMYEAFETAGVGTYICMHMKEDHIELARKYHINVIVAGHMPSDSLGMNIMYGELERKGELEIIRFSGLLPPEDL